MTKQAFLEKYLDKVMGRILAGLAADHQDARLGQYARHVMDGSAALLMQMYDDLCPETGKPPAQPPTKGAK